MNIVFLYAGAGWFLAAVAVLQVPIWAALAIYHQKDCTSFFQVIRCV